MPGEFHRSGAASLQDTLDELGRLATIRGDAAEAETIARAQAFVRARQIASDADLGPLFDAPPDDLDAEVLKRLRQMYEAGGWVLLESTLADLPADLRWLYESGAVTLRQLAALTTDLQITSVADLAAALSSERVRHVEGFDVRAEAAIASALPTLRARVPRVPLGRAVAIAEPVLARLRSTPGVEWAVPSGSLRRGHDTVGDIELVASTSNPAAAIEQVLADPDVARCLHRSERQLYVLLDRVQIGVRLPEPATAGASLLYFTGSARHFEALQARARSKQWTLGPSRFATLDGAILSASTEDEVYQALGLPCIPPEIRESSDELSAADQGELPAFISRRDIRGDLHMHSEWSDGRDPIESMVQTCVALGYEYMAITDHSPTSAASRNLSIDGAKRQAEEVARLREQYPVITILHGCEVDILADGRLDFPDRVLEQFDIVLASLHERAGHGPDQLMHRYVAAMKHPLVTMITHPTNRLVGHRAGYDLDYDRLFALAVETGTVLEVDGSPAHLDLDGVLARRAIAAGATVAVDSDCHRADLLERQMHLGIVTARRGWVEPRHVLNTRPLHEVRAFIGAKRGAH